MHTKYAYDEQQDKLIVCNTQDVEPILKANKRARNDFSGRHKSEAFNKVASIPLVVAEKWRTELGVDVFDQNHAKKVMQLLNSPDYAYLRTGGGRL